MPWHERPREALKPVPPITIREHLARARDGASREISHPRVGMAGPVLAGGAGGAVLGVALSLLF